MNTDNDNLYPQVRLADVATVVRGSSPRPAGDPQYFNGSFLPWITVADLTRDGDPFLTSTLSHLTEEGARRTRIFEPGTVLLTNSGATLGVPKICRIRAGANDGVAGFLSLSSEIDTLYLYYCLSALTNYLRKEVASGVGQPNLNTELIGNVHITKPALSTQRAIACILSTWDRGIRQLSDLVAAKLRFKQGLMQQLLTGRRRFKEFHDKWRTVHLKDVAEECEERNRGRLGTDSVMAVKKAEGIVPMRERTIAADIDRYSVVKKDCFAYNPMRLNIGSIARWSGDRDVLVSPDYVVFHCKKPTEGRPTIDTGFLDQYRRSSLWERYVTSSGNGSVRVRIYFSDLGGMKLNLPSMPEQRKIAATLNTADREIDLLRKELDALKTQKKGLMQKLLTGQVRVKVAPELNAQGPKP